MVTWCDLCVFMMVAVAAGGASELRESVRPRFGIEANIVTAIQASMSKSNAKLLTNKTYVTGGSQAGGASELRESVHPRSGDEANIITAIQASLSKSNAKLLTNKTYVTGGSQAAYCDCVYLTGTNTHSIAHGKYTRTGTGCSYGANKYLHSTGTVMYKTREVLSGEPFWAVSNSACSQAVYMTAFDSALYPEDIRSTWQEAATGGVFVNNPSIAVECVQCGGSSPAPAAMIIVITITLLMKWF